MGNRLPFNLKDELPPGKEITREVLKTIFQLLIEEQISKDKIQIKRYKTFLRELYLLANVKKKISIYFFELIFLKFFNSAV
jgi:hypothetical protein